MKQIVHRISLGIYVTIVLAIIIGLSFYGYSFYRLPIEERFFHPYYSMLKSSGLLGHGLGIVGTLCIMIGLFTYMARKRLRLFAQIGILKYWLDFHIFMCTLGPVMVLFHTSFKFGGLVSIGFWSMIIVVASGAIGRFIYLQIPHSIEGREMSMSEIEDMKNALLNELQTKYNVDPEMYDTRDYATLKSQIAATGVSDSDIRRIRKLVKRRDRLTKRINRLEKMQNLFRYWHVAHLPFALAMLIIVMIHVVVAVVFGYKWIF